MRHRSLWSFGLTVYLLAFVSLGLPGLARPQPAAEKKTVRLLTVGNSFSQNATRYLSDLTKTAGHVLVHHRAEVGGATLALHWDKAEAYERDAKDPRGLYAGGKSLKQILQSEPLDFVTMQQASIKSHDLTTYRPFATQLHGFIKKHNPRAEVLVHQTWAYRADDPRFHRTTTPPGEPATRQAMHDGLTKAYETIAGELGVRIIPVGDAFNLAENDVKWSFRPDRAFDVKSAKAPTLPDQKHSLHTGWRWTKQKDGREKLGMDGHHASIAGQYLGACVFFEVLFSESVVGNKYAPAELDASHVRFLQETAHSAVAQRRARK